MAERIPQSTAYLVVFRAYLASDGKTPATGKTIAITISKNGGAFGNPNAGATNATEISSGFYKFTLDTTDAGTVGPLGWRGAEGTINDAGDVLSVIAPANVNVLTVSNDAITAAAIANGAIDRATFAADTGLQSVRSNTAQAGAATTITLDAGASAVDDFYNTLGILTTGGTGAGQYRTIIDYVGATKVATVDTAWIVNPDNTTTFAIFPAGATVTDIATAVWASVTRTLSAGTNIVLAKGVGVTGFTDLSAAQVNAEVVDALAVDTYAEPAQGTPPATTTLAVKIAFLYKAWRNRSNQTATAYKLFNDDAVTVDHKATVSDDGTTFESGEKATGP